VTLLRVSTDDANGTIESYIAEGALTNDAATTWGGIGVVQIPRLQQLLNYMCKQNFEHHVAINLSNVAGSVVEAVQEYLGWKIYAHACGDS
jgi:L-fucose isomerase-like protein